MGMNAKTVIKSLETVHSVPQNLGRISMLIALLSQWSFSNLRDIIISPQAHRATAKYPCTTCMKEHWKTNAKPTNKKGASAGCAIASCRKVRNPETLRRSIMGLELGYSLGGATGVYWEPGQLSCTAPKKSV